jgi:hypothetical protein
VSQFEFIFVLISIIAGLALAQLMSGMTRTPRTPDDKIDVTHLLFSAGTIVLLITVWWSTFRWQSYEAWTVVEFLLLCFYISLFYVKAVILSPLGASQMPTFEQIRGRFYSVVALYCVVEPIVIQLRDGTLAPWFYIPMMLQFFILAGIGIYLRNSFYDRLYSLWFLLVNLAWIFLARFTG